MAILIKNGRVIDPKNNVDEIRDVYIENGKIEGVCPADEIIDATGKIVAPGLVDMHCHLREPGQEYKEDIASGTKSAAAGGFTSIACMPNTIPSIDNAEVVRFIKSRAADVNVYVIGAITKGQNGEELAAIDEMIAEGIIAISDDGKWVQNHELMLNALKFGLPVISHCEPEEEAIEREIALAESHGKSVHIAHVSLKGSVELIRQAKARGVKVTCETCPQYFSLPEGTYKINPPLATPGDIEAIREGLRDGTIDVIATDHAPHHDDEKKGEWDKQCFGMIGFETAFGLGVTYSGLTINELICKMTCAPSGILRINKGTLDIGADADIIIADIDKEYVVDVSTFKSKAKNSPFDGYSLKGRIEVTIVGGRICQ